MNPKTQHIALIGGGLAGSLLSIYLAKHNFKVDVYERRPDARQRLVDGGRSINLALSHRGWQSLERAGLAESVRELGIPMTGRRIHQTDGSVDYQPYGRQGEAIYSVSRGELNRALDRASSALPQVDYHYETSLQGLDVGSGILYFKGADGKNFNRQPDLIVGADGAFSRVRGAMQRRKRFNYSQSFLPHGYKELSIPAGENGQFLLDKHALHIWPRRSFMLIALPNLDGSFTCTLFLAYEGETSFEQLTDAASVRAFFKREFPDALPLMPTLVEDFFGNPTDSLVTIRCNPWTYRTDNGSHIALIGDASHAIVPFYGQGMNAAFEDCFVFDRLVEKHLGGTDQIDWEQMLDEYQRLRIPDADAIADLALKNFIEMRDSVADDRFLLRKQIEKHLQTTYPESFTPAYSLVTFRPDVRYSEALRRGKIQDRLFAELLSDDDVEQKWTRSDLDAELTRLMEDYEAAVSGQAIESR